MKIYFKHSFSLCILLLAICLPAKAQDIHFSQFYASAFAINPAQTGNFNGNWRLSNDYRSQWKSVSKPYVTNAIAYDQPFFVLGQKIGAGFTWINDASGIANLQVNKFIFSGSYFKAFGPNNFRAGYQVGYVQKSFTYNGITFPSQLGDLGYFDGKLPSGEEEKNYQLSYIDMNAGLLWNRKFGKFNPEIGLSFFHINKPNETFFGGKNALPIRTAFTFGGSYQLNASIVILPHILYMRQQGATDFMFGTNIGYSLGANKLNIKYLYAGALVRSDVITATDAGIAIVGIHFRAMDVGFSYDMNVSRLKIASGYKGATELSFIYTGLSTHLNKTQIPCDRY